MSPEISIQLASLALIVAVILTLITLVIKFSEKFSSLEATLVRLESKMDQQIGQLDSKADNSDMVQLRADLQSEVTQLGADVKIVKNNQDHLQKDVDNLKGALEEPQVA